MGEGCDQPWKPSLATENIRRLGRHDRLKLTVTGHARDQMHLRTLITGDVLYILKNGFVYNNPVEATQPGLWKYEVETRTPNSENRIVRIVAIPDLVRVWVKIVTVMWADE